ALVQRLAATADVVLSNYRLGVAERLGIDDDTLRRANPALIYWQNSGFGEHGPRAHRPAADLGIQAFSGLMTTIGKVDEEGAPAGSTIPFSDVIAALGR